MKETRLAIRHTTTKILIRAFVAVIVGLTIGIGSVHAEWLFGVDVPGAGNVANAATYRDANGCTDVMVNCDRGLSTASILLYHIFAGIKLWHPPPPEGGSPLLQDWDYKQWFNSNGGLTKIAVSSGYGDKATTRSTFRYTTSWHSSIYYTSFPDNSASCSNHWYYGTPC